ncbi:MAG: DegV family protein [Clostridia bacterium]|nr:DegV family protein [Clostridia bacterium]
MSVRIIIDSTTDLTTDVQGKVTVVPLTILFGAEEYVDGVDIDHATFYEKLVNSDMTPTTSQATPDQFMNVFRKVEQAGDEAVVITIASKLSGTYQSAHTAAQDMNGIYIVDSDTVAIGAGVLVKYAVELAERGMSAAEIAEKLEAAKGSVKLVAMVDTLEYLKRGGRISKTVAFAGGLMNIKPIINVDKGVIGMLGKARGIKQGLVQLRSEIEKLGGIDFEKPVLMGYTGLDASNLDKFVSESAKIWERAEDSIPRTIIGSVVGTHAGPGAVAAAFFAK